MSASIKTTQRTTGITEVTRGSAKLVTPPPEPDGRTYRYGVAAPFQVAPQTAALSVAIRNEGYPVGDFENGTDFILFDDLNHIPSDRAIQICRNDKYVRPDTGERRIAIKYPIRGGFVPWGAKQADGSAHPHAGTGFGLNEVLDFPMKGDGYYDKADKRTTMVRSTEVHQFSYDGQTFQVDANQVFTPQEPLYATGSEWAITWPSLNEAVPDGDDWLFPVLTTAGDPAAWYSNPMSSGVSRWRRMDGTWQPVSFVPIAICPIVPIALDAEKEAECGLWLEPSLIRDMDGALLFTARGCYGENNHKVKIWRSTDGAQTWELIIDLDQARGQSTITLGRAADGTPYIVANALGRERDLLCIWPLNADRTGLEEPITARDALEEFGPPPSGIVWFMDHPGSSTVRLADGNWHHVLSYRIMDRGEHAGGDPPPQTGQYVEEVISSGPPMPVWSFESTPA